MDDRFWLLCDELARSSQVQIDRPRGTLHPRWSFEYPLDYGFLVGTRSSEGAGVDIWRGSLEQTGVTGAILTVDLLKRDCEIKLLLGCTPEEAAAALRIHTARSQAAMLVPRTNTRAFPYS